MTNGVIVMTTTSFDVKILNVVEIKKIKVNSRKRVLAKALINRHETYDKAPVKSNDMQTNAIEMTSKMIVYGSTVLPSSPIMDDHISLGDICTVHNNSKQPINGGYRYEMVTLTPLI